MVNTGHALRETSDALLRDLDVLAQLEDEKRTLEPGDPRLVDLAGRVEQIAQRVLAGTVRQHELTRVANAAVEAGSTTAPKSTIDDTPPRPIQAVLAEWREAERHAAEVEPGSADATETSARISSLREEYRRSHEAVRQDR